MSEKNESIKSIAINIVSNIIFQIILMIGSGSGISYILLEKIHHLQMNKLTISVFQMITLCICGSIFILAFFMFALSIFKN